MSVINSFLPDVSCHPSRAIAADCRAGGLLRLSFAFRSLLVATRERSLCHRAPGSSRPSRPTQAVNRP
jgi:hypothetical protein